MSAPIDILMGIFKLTLPFSSESLKLNILQTFIPNSLTAWCVYLYLYEHGYVWICMCVCVYVGIEGLGFITYPFQNINGGLIEV